MATKTYLQLINAVLLELREPVATAYNSTDYVKLIASYVNVAKRNVENSWTWTALRTSFSAVCVAGTPHYTLTGAFPRFRVLHPETDVYNYTKKWPLVELNRSAHRALCFGDTSTTTGVATGPPTAYSFVEQLTNNHRLLAVHPVPAANGDVIKVFGYNPPEDFGADADICYIPTRPIEEVALALARGERGEDGGITSSEAAAFAMRASQDEIALDAGVYDEDTQWEPV